MGFPETDYRADLEQAAVAIVRTSLEGGLQYVNRAFCAMTGYWPAEALKLNIRDITHPDDIAISTELRASLAEGSERPYQREVRIRPKAGEYLWASVATSLVRDTDGRTMHFVTVLSDISERKAQQEKIERLSRVYSMLSGINSLIVRSRDRAQLLRESCRIAREMGGFGAVAIWLIDAQKMIAEPVAWAGDDQAVRWLRHARFPVKEEVCRSLLVELMRTRRPAITNDVRHDSRLPCGDSLARFGINSAVFLPLLVAGRLQGVLAMYSPRKDQFDEAEVKLLSELAADVSFAIEHLDQSERAAYLALYDELTGLANRHLLMERLGQLLQTNGRAQGKLALALLDVERLRAVNRALGRGTGDALLRQIGERLTKSAGAGVVARNGSNHFVLVLASVSDRSDAERLLAVHLHACFAAPYVINGTEIKVGVKAGLVVFPTDGGDAETLLVNAEAALRKAKETGERHVCYTEDIGERTGVWLSLESKLARALQSGEFVLHYQPKVDTATRRVVGLEALIRWQSPDFGLVSPEKFIPLMEETGMILDVGAWALRRAALDQREWSDQGFKSLRVAVNVSVVQLRQRHFVQSVEEAIRGGAAPAGIDLEMTESLVMENVEATIRKLEAIRALGVHVAIDDFGTGYSSLAYLAKLPVQVLKIDRSFIAAMLRDRAAMTLVQTIISLAHALRLKVVAEGVEQEQQAKYLRLLRCDQIQGYLVSKPVPFDEMTRLLQRRRPAK